MTDDDHHEAMGAMLHRQRTEASEAVKEMMKRATTVQRKIVQLSATTEEFYGLCNDGSIWQLKWQHGGSLTPGEWYWKRLPDIPQDIK